MENIKRTHFQACIGKSYTTDSGDIQGRHKEGALSGMHRESYTTDSGGYSTDSGMHSESYTTDIQEDIKRDSGDIQGKT